jgi:diadenosine tetraphosphatase ApaH/serine/threonine PP2A family protein phosphatase
MDDFARKLFRLLDSDFEGERHNALEMLRQHFARHGGSFSGLVETLDQYRAANEAAARLHEAMTHQLEILDRRARLRVVHSDDGF